MLLQELSEQQHISIQNIYYMLTYVFNAPVKSSLEDLRTEEFDNVYDLFAKLLSVYIGRLVKQGLYREYIYTSADIPVLRGKINIAGTIKHHVANRILLSCEYDDLSENILLNQIIKTTAMLIITDNRFNPEYKAELKKAMLYFSNVSTISYASIPWENIRFHQNNQTYHFLINICEFLIKELLPSYGKKGPKRLELIDDRWTLPKFYEKFVLEYYKKEYKNRIVANSKQIKWKTDNEGDLEKLPKMQSDITLTHGDKVLIIDTKYYTHTTYTQARLYDDDDDSDNSDSKYKLHSANLYQIFTYVKNKAAEYKESKAKEVSGMLLYAQTDEPITRQPNTKFNIDDSKIYVQTLNLNCPFPETKAQLNEIVEKYFYIR